MFQLQHFVDFAYKLFSSLFHVKLVGLLWHHVCSLHFFFSPILSFATYNKNSCSPCALDWSKNEHCICCLQNLTYFPCAKLTRGRVHFHVFFFLICLQFLNVRIRIEISEALWCVIWPTKWSFLTVGAPRKKNF